MNEAERVKEEVKERFLHHVGNVIRTYRKRRGIERHVLASALGCDDTTLSRYELGSADIKASTMAYISVLCNFPMRKYTEIYADEPAAIVFNFEELIKISAPVKHRKSKNTSTNIPPKPRLEFDEKEWKWVMKESYLQLDKSPDIDYYMWTPESLEETFLDYIQADVNKHKYRLMLHLMDMVDEETGHGTRKCPNNLKVLIRASIKYILSSGDYELTQRLLAYRKKIAGEE